MHTRWLKLLWLLARGRTRVPRSGCAPTRQSICLTSCPPPWGLCAILYILPVRWPSIRSLEKSDQAVRACAESDAYVCLHQMYYVFFFHALLAAAMRACMPLRGRCCTALLVVVVVFVSTVSLLVIIISQPHTTALVERGRRPARTKHTEKKERATLSRSLSHAREKIRARGVVILETSSPDLWKCVYACV
jgi:hypothetical protein